MDTTLLTSYKENPTTETKKKLLIEHVNLVHHVLHKSQIPDSDILDEKDFFQFGMEGLSEAIDLFDPDYGTRFETYAIQRIRGKIWDEIRKIKNPKIAEDNPNFTSPPIPHDSDLDEEGIHLYDLVEDYCPCPDESAENTELKEKLRELIKYLPERDRSILSLYYYEELNYREIASTFKISISEVSRIHSKIIHHFRRELEKEGLFP